MQFLHPGVEHQPDSGGKKGWNRGIHRRKFLLANGRAMRGSQSDEGQLVFWGEWEPESEVIQTYQVRHKGEPERLGHPYFAVPQSYDGHQKPDPFVSGRYLWHLPGVQEEPVRQKLRYLSRGSVILFGSCLADEFVKHGLGGPDFVDHRVETYASALAGAGVPRSIWL